MGQELPLDWGGRTANLMLLLASGMDFLITAISLNQRFQQIIDPQFDHDDWSRSGCLKWFLYSLPSLVVSFVMLCFIPDLETFRMFEVVSLFAAEPSGQLRHVVFHTRSGDAVWAHDGLRSALLTDLGPFHHHPARREAGI